ncbi:MAG: DUF3833 domain-containing protein [Acetobacteraceae bacterium]
MAALAALAGCSDPLPVAAFQAAGPAMDPLRFFAGHVRSWGVLENRSGQPTSIVLTDCQGEPEGTDGLHMTQRLQVGTDAPVTREWHMRRVGPGRFEATANDMVGTATGEAAGRAFHWQWVLALQPGNPIKDVTMDQWWYLLDDGSLLNRTTIRKLGIIAAEVTEHFARAS